MERKVMIVDDEPDIRLAVRVVLQPMGFQVISVENGESCIEEMEKGFKGVVLMDIMMPGGMDGWQTIREIKKKGLDRGNLLAMLTAKQQPDADLEELTEYVFDYIRKPFESSELVEKVTEYCTLLTELEEMIS